MNLERDFGKVEANVEILKADMAEVKKDLSEIKRAVLDKNAIASSDKARLGVVAVLASIGTHIVTWMKPFG